MSPERLLEREAAQRTEHRTWRPFRQAILQGARRVGDHARFRVASPNSVIALLAAAPPSAERFCRIERRNRDEVDLFPVEVGELEARVDGPIGKPDLELALGETLFVHGEAKPSLLQERGAGIVAVPDAEYVHDLFRLEVSALDVPGDPVTWSNEVQRQNHFILLRFFRENRVFEDTFYFCLYFGLTGGAPRIERKVLHLVAKLALHRSVLRFIELHLQGGHVHVWIQSVHCLRIHGFVRGAVVFEQLLNLTLRILLGGRRHWNLSSTGSRGRRVDDPWRRRCGRAGGRRWR